MPFPVKNIRNACRLSGITLAELEREIGIGNGVIAKWENGKKSPPLDRLQMIARRFGMTVEELSTPDYPEWEIAASVLNAKNAAVQEDSGITDTQREIIRRIPQLSEQTCLALLAAINAIEESRNRQDD